MHQYTIANAKNSLSRIVHEAEEGETVHLTRRGKLVAVLLSAKEYQKMSKRQSSPADALKAFMDDKTFDNIDIEPSTFSDLRPKTSGRDIQL